MLATNGQEGLEIAVTEGFARRLTDVLSGEDESPFSSIAASTWIIVGPLMWTSAIFLLRMERSAPYALLTCSHQATRTVPPLTMYRLVAATETGRGVS